MFRITSLSLILLTWLTACSQPVAPDFTNTEMAPGGGMTGKGLTDRTLIQVGRNVSKMEELDAWTGFSLFRDPWVIAPSSTTGRDGLGPLFNTRSCISCHTLGSRGPAPLVGQSTPSALVMRLGSLTRPAFSDPVYGGQLQSRGIKVTHLAQIPQLAGEAQLNLTYKEINGQFNDGTPYSLRQPEYQLTHLAYGPLAEHTQMSPRFSPAIYGLGLLDAIAMEDLLKQEDIDDSDQDGISAKYNRVPLIRTSHNTAQFHAPNQESMALGRFGLKAKQPSLVQQVAAAFRDDIGITNSLFPEESCTQGQTNCQAAAKVGGHTSTEIADDMLYTVTLFNQLLAVPPTRGLDTEQAQQGRHIFYQIGCESCHTATYTTAQDYPHESLANQTIWPYTDLALHDMGPGLADNMREFDASGQEWRTPALWGIGARKQIRAENLFLHDGRARNLTEAILWHGGEGLPSQQAFIQLNSTQRKALLAFLNAI